MMMRLSSPPCCAKSTTSRPRKVRAIFCWVWTCAIHCCPSRAITPIFTTPASSIWLHGLMEVICMSNSTSVLPALTSPHCDARPDRRLLGAAVSPASLTRRERDEMYGLLEAYFDGTHRGRFEADLAEKDSVLPLRQSESG